MTPERKSRTGIDRLLAAAPGVATRCKIEMMIPDLVSARVTVNPQVRSGQPIIRGTRITVWDIFGWLGAGLNESKILSDYPELSSKDIQAALQFAYHLKDKVT